MNQPVLLLERHYLQRLHVEWKPQSSPDAPGAESVRCDFDYDVGTHLTEKRRRMIALRVRAQQVDGTGNPAGYLIECEIVGFFQLTAAIAEGKEEMTLRLNGFSILYGILRGILSMATGVFEGGVFALPSIMPQDVVKDVESKRSAKRVQPATKGV